ncbi:MAG: DUF3857 domain-containing protein [Cytophagales bacterium]|nr:DUF3857 domain-containing protein [Cytophagales bacterium]
MRLILSGLLLISFQAISQRYTPTFGTITESELALTAYPAEPDAEAVVLFDIGESTFIDTQEGYDIRFVHTKRMKVLTRGGIKFATLNINYYHEEPKGTEKVTSIEAFTYNLENGRTVRKALDPTTVFDERLSNRWSTKKFVFPDVKEGSVIEYRYTLETPFHFNLPDWTFQDQIPTVYSEYTVKMIPFYEYVFLAQGITRFSYQHSELSKVKRTWGTVAESMGQRVGNGIEFVDYEHTYAMKDVPSFRDESFITSREDYVMKIDFQLSKFFRPTGGSREIITTWPALNDALLKHEHFGKYLGSSMKIARKILETDLKLADASTEKKVEQIVQYVRSNFRWNNQNNYYASKSAKEFFEQKSGNSADINLFLTALLSSAGVPALPVILSTRNHGKIIADYPFEHYFNYVVVLVNGQRPFLTDGTEPALGYDRIPIRCINEKGLVVEAGKELKWVGLDQKIPSIDHKIITWTIDPLSATASASISIQATEYAALQYKRDFLNDSVRIKKNMQEKHSLKAFGINTFNYDNGNKPYVITFKGVVEVEKIGDKIVLSPLLGFPMKKNELVQQKRSYPIDFSYSWADKYKATVTIPAGFRITTLPENVTMDNDIAQIKISYTTAGDQLELEAEYAIKKSIYPSADYTKLKFYLDMIVRHFNESIILEKI